MRTTRLLRHALGLMFLLAATGSHARLSDKDLEAFQLLVLGPKSNEVKGCLDASFGIIEGLLVAAQAPDSKVEELLTRGEMSASQREMRSQQAALWKAHHSPAKLADFQYAWCLKDKGLPPVNLGEAGEACFNLATVPVYASLLKTGFKAGQSEAMEKVSATWGQQLKEPFLKQVVGDIYAAEDAEKATLVMRRVFVACVVGQHKR